MELTTGLIGFAFWDNAILRRIITQIVRKNNYKTVKKRRRPPFFEESEKIGILLWTYIANIV